MNYWTHEKTRKIYNDLGYQFATTERKNSYTRMTSDLFGFIDAIAMKPFEPLLGLQVTTADNRLSHMDKLMQKEIQQAMVHWLSTGSRLILIIWTKEENKSGRGYRYSMVEEAITTEHQFLKKYYQDLVRRHPISSKGKA